MTTDTNTWTGADTQTDARTDPALVADTTGAPAAQPDPRPLSDFVPDLSRASTGSATVVTVDDRVVVVLRADRIGGGVQVHDPVRSVHTLLADTPATAVSDHHTRAEFLAAAACDLAGIHALDQAQLDGAETRHQKALDDIRRYAIARFLEDAFCLNGLNAFLRAFGLPTYTPRTRVTYTITGSYDVDTDDADYAARDARGYLKPDLSGLDNVIDGSGTHSIRLDQIDQLDT